MVFGLIGEHLSHSYSKEIHNLITDDEYELKEIAPDKLDEFMNSRNFQGINVTIPYKEKVIPYLDYVSDDALEIGAVNTVVNKNGKLYGYNTDFYGMKASFIRCGFDFNNKKILITGTGGTSKTAYAVSKSMGAKTVCFTSRRPRNNVLSYDEIYKKCVDFDYIINTTPVGMYPETGFSPVDITKFSNVDGVFDVIYNPLRTVFTRSASEMNIPHGNGLYMLCAQAVYASALFRGVEPDFTLCDKIYQKVLFQKQNIVLIGMPSSGKSTVGSILSEKMNKAFCDTDDLIVDKIKMNISDFFRMYGEERFRKIECETVKEVSLLNSRIIATGGGVVLNRRNIDCLKQNGITVFIDRSPENLIATKSRPLSSDKSAVMKLYEQRYSLYKKFADITVDGDKQAESVAEDIIRRVSE